MFLSWLAAGILLAGGCAPLPAASGPSCPTRAGQELSGTLRVYADDSRRNALTRVFRSLNSRYPGLEAQWAASPEESDIVVTGCIPAEESSAYRTLDDTAQAVGGALIQELLFRDERGVIGLPLFLRADCYWYDQLLYRKTETETPFSLESFQASPIRGDYPAVCDAADMDSLFWSTLAPLYLSAGGTAEELADGTFRAPIMLPAVRRLRELCASGMLVIREQAAERFITNNTMFWIADFASMADIRYDMPNLSDVGFAPTLVYHQQDTPFIALRADVVAVRAAADPALTDAFLETLYDNKTLVNLCSDAKIPLACRLSFGSHSVPELVDSSYAILASPSLQTDYVSCRWNAAVRSRIIRAVADIAGGAMTAEEGCAALCGTA